MLQYCIGFVSLNTGEIGIWRTIQKHMVKVSLYFFFPRCRLFFYDTWHHTHFRHATQLFVTCVYCKIMTTVILVLIYYCDPSSHTVSIFSCGENFKICSLSNFQVYNTLLLTIVTTLCIIFPWLICNGKSVSTSPILAPPPKPCLCKPPKCFLYLCFVLCGYWFLIPHLSELI